MHVLKLHNHNLWTAIDERGVVVFLFALQLCSPPIHGLPLQPPTGQLLRPI